ncbi:MAG: NFACT RNA binding domain-containing protein [Gemmatimonadota bacterium]
MTIRHDSVLVQALAREISERWSGCAVVGLHLAPEQHRAQLVFEDGSALLACLEPGAGYILAQAEVAPPAKGRMTFARKGLRLAGAAAPPDERVLLIELANDEGQVRSTFVLELQPRKWNAAYVTSGQGLVRAALRQQTRGERTLIGGKPYSAPASRRSWAADLPSGADWAATIVGLEVEGRRAAILASISYTSGLNVDFLLGSAMACTDVGADELKQAYDRYTALRTWTPGAAAWLVSTPAGLQPYVSSLSDPGAASFGSLLEAMGSAADGSDSARSTALSEWRAADRTGEEADLELALRRKLNRIERRLAAMRRQIEAGGGDELRQIGHLLLAKQHEIERGAGEATLEDFSGELRTIELDPALSVTDNAASYYESARRRDRALSRLPAKIRGDERTAGRLRDALGLLGAEGASPEAWKLAGGRPAVAQAPPGAADATSLPYRVLHTTSGREIRVGRSARGNDDLTFRHSSPDDVWLHARQVHGAHVILRWDSKDQNPSRRDLQEAAVAAACNSEARHSGTVAVDWTRRKYVRKPRKAPPGSVTVERTRTLFVSPDETLLKRLAAEPDS